MEPFIKMYCAVGIVYFFFAFYRDVIHLGRRKRDDMNAQTEQDNYKTLTDARDLWRKRYEQADRMAAELSDRNLKLEQENSSLKAKLTRKRKPSVAAP